MMLDVREFLEVVEAEEAVDEPVEDEEWRVGGILFIPDSPAGKVSPHPSCVKIIIIIIVIIIVINETIQTAIN